MVQIPTSRDVLYAGTRSGRIAPNGPSVSVGAAVAGFGTDLVQSAFNLNDLRTQEQADLRNDKSNAVSTNLNKFVQAEEERFLKARDGASESGIGFTRQFMEGYKERADAFAKSNFEGLTSDAQTGYNNNLLSAGNSIFDKATAFENETKASYYDRSTKGSLDGIRTQIQANSASFDDLKKRGVEAIDATNMPEAWKADRRAQWDADAAESKWKWNYSQNPKAAVNDLRPAPDTASLLRQEEGFRNKPYWDTNAWRIGYGSDTVTTKDGRHIPVTPDMVITQEDAERDLQYRLTEREGAQARTQVGDAWSNLPGNVQSALESVAYNYGSLPSEVVTAAKSGDTNAIADAVAALPVNSKRRQREAAIIRGTETLPMVDKYASIPADRREQLATWGETQYNQQRTQQRAAAKDGYSLLIATQPDQVKESVILGDSTLDNGDKAALITSLHSALKENAGVNSFIGAVASGNVSVNPFDEDQRKVADKGYEKLLGATADPQEQAAVTSDFVARTGYVPKKVQAELRQGAASTDPAQMAQSMQAAMVLAKNAPVSFGSFDGSDAVRRKMDLYRTYTQDMGYSPDQAARKLIDANDPEKAAQREALVKSKTVADELKKVDASTVSAVFDKGVFHAAPDLGPTPAASAAMVADYKALYEEAIVDANGDLEAAKKAAADRFQRSYGVSEFSTMGSSIVVKNPPEKAYPAAPDGTHDYIHDQLREALKAEGINAEEVYLQPDDMTAQDIRSGKPPRYTVFYKASSFSRAPGLLGEAQKQYPVLRGKKVAFVSTPNANSDGNMLEAWPPGEEGTADYPRPKELPLDEYGIQVFSEDTKPSDVAGDVISHFLVNEDPALKAQYQQFSATFDTPKAQARLREDYKWAQDNEGERRPFDEWAKIDRIPAYFRGYVFKQWPEKAYSEMYSPDQRAIMDKMANYIKSATADGDKVGTLQRFHLPFYADPSVMQEQFKLKKADMLKQSEQRMIQNRDTEVKTRNAVDDAMNNTVGPAWMKAGAADTAREKVINDKLLGSPINPSTAEQGGGGGGF